MIMIKHLTKIHLFQIETLQFVQNKGNDRFRSPPVIPEQNRIMSMSNTRNGNSSYQYSNRLPGHSVSLKKTKIYFKNRFKSVSPRELKHSAVLFQKFHPQILEQVRNKGRKQNKVKMNTKISRLLETFQSIPIKIQNRKEQQKEISPKIQNKINISLK